ncbi:MAG: SpoIVB peptidase S55 domain-containing protein [Paenisporosarcina sp.]
MRWNVRNRVIAIFAICFFTIPMHSLASSSPSELVPMGQSIGVQLKLENVTFVHDVLIDEKIWFKSGDQILKMEQVKIHSTNDWKQSIAKMESDQVTVYFSRGNKKDQISVLKNQLNDMVPFMRDHTEGIGTLTYLDPKTNEYGALGHQIVDQQIKETPPFLGGTIFLSEIASVHKSKPGSPGYKIAKQTSIQVEAGIVEANTIYGIFGNLLDNDLMDGRSIPTLQANEIKEGKAEILTTVNGKKVETYSIEIIKVEINTFQFKITDNRLIEKTGGILQGMSGSPVIQNGKFAGAVTHMVVDNPLKGAAISIREMIKREP